MLRTAVYSVSIAATLLLLATLVLWVRSYVEADVIQWAGVSNVRTADERGLGGILAVHLDAFATAPGTIDLYHRRLTYRDTDLNQATQMARFEGIEPKISFFHQPYSSSPFGFLSRSIWPRSGFHWRMDHASPHESRTLDVGVPLWFIAMVLASVAATSWVSCVRRGRKRKDVAPKDSSTRSAPAA